MAGRPTYSIPHHSTAVRYYTLAVWGLVVLMGRGAAQSPSP
jgi:hypothetical protein